MGDTASSEDLILEDSSNSLLIGTVITAIVAGLFTVGGGGRYAVPIVNFMRYKIPLSISIGILIVQSVCTMIWYRWKNRHLYKGKEMNFLKIHYGNIEYKIPIPRSRHPNPFLSITTTSTTSTTDDVHKDVSDVLKPYLGPNYNFFGTKMTPKKLGFENLTFYTDEGDLLSFESTDEISCV